MPVTGDRGACVGRVAGQLTGIHLPGLLREIDPLVCRSSKSHLVGSLCLRIGTRGLCVLEKAHAGCLLGDGPGALRLYPYFRLSAGGLPWIRWGRRRNDLSFVEIGDRQCLGRNGTYRRLRNGLDEDRSLGSLAGGSVVGFDERSTDGCCSLPKFGGSFCIRLSDRKCSLFDGQLFFNGQDFSQYVRDSRALFARLLSSFWRPLFLSPKRLQWGEPKI